MSDNVSLEGRGLSNRISTQDVEEWFQYAWGPLEHYPSEHVSFRICTWLRSFVDRSNARSGTRTGDDIFRDRKAAHRETHKRARALIKICGPVLDHLRQDYDFMKKSIKDPEVIAPGLQSQIIALEAVKEAVENLLELPIPFNVRDHTNPILVIAHLAEEGWQDLWDRGCDSEKHEVSFGKRPEDPMAVFVKFALDGIGWGATGADGCSLDTISDHLRGRQNRPRLR